jgi:N-acetylglucosaminyldiphosphoundecaprenol N-acetyl-beta-D-mannosaminyltransferase
MGLEWTHRLAMEPGRLAGRYLRDGIPFAGRLGTWAIAKRFAREDKSAPQPQAVAQGQVA